MCIEILCLVIEIFVCLSFYGAKAKNEREGLEKENTEWKWVRFWKSVYLKECVFYKVRCVWVWMNVFGCVRVGVWGCAGRESEEEEEIKTLSFWSTLRVHIKLDLGISYKSDP